jgi:addiction module HigA family antidote
MKKPAPLKRGMRPTHPGEILKEDILPELGITQLEFANRLGVSRRTISEILRQRRPVTPDMAMRLSKAFNPSAEFWLSMQATYDLWKLDNTKSKAYAKIVSLPVPAKRKAG